MKQKVRFALRKGRGAIDHHQHAGSSFFHLDCQVLLGIVGMSNQRIDIIINDMKMHIVNLNDQNVTLVKGRC